MASKTNDFKVEDQRLLAREGVTSELRQMARLINSYYLNMERLRAKNVPPVTPRAAFCTMRGFAVDLSQHSPRRCAQRIGRVIESLEQLQDLMVQCEPEKECSPGRYDEFIEG